MIFLFTDFGYQGSYVGQMKAALARHGTTVALFDLMHDAPKFNPKASACLLASLTCYLPENCVTVAVVDPGVGNPDRRAIMLKADSRWFVGPDNGLLNSVALTAREHRFYEILWRPSVLSNSFHGRDLFAPVAAQLTTGVIPESIPLDSQEVITTGWSLDLMEVIYVDGFGNCMTGIRASQLHTQNRLQINETTFSHARTFSAVNKGEGFWYENSNGLVEVAVNQGSAAEKFGLGIGNTVSVVQGDINT